MLDSNCHADTDPSAADAYSITVSVCISHGDTKSYPVSITIPVSDRAAALAFAHAIRDAVQSYEAKDVRD